MKPRFFHILFVDSDNDKCVTNVEVRPSTHRRQEQPPSCVCGAPAPATQNSRIICVQHSCTHVTRKPCNRVPHLHRHADAYVEYSKMLEGFKAPGALDQFAARENGAK